MKLKIMMIATALAATVYGATYDDGTYRGNFIDGADTQVTVQYMLKDDVITSIRYRHLAFNGENYLKKPELSKQKAQYEALLKHSIGKKVQEAMTSLYSPEDIEQAGATVKGMKVRSAIKDGLNRDPYYYVDKSHK